MNELVSGHEMKHYAVLLKIKLSSSAIFTCRGVLVKSTSAGRCILA